MILCKAKGGEQGDPLIPALFALGLHQALVAVQAGLLPSERLFAFLDDIYVVCSLDRVADVHASLQAELWRHARIQVHRHSYGTELLRLELRMRTPSCGEVTRLCFRRSRA